MLCSKRQIMRRLVPSSTPSLVLLAAISLTTVIAAAEETRFSADVFGYIHNKDFQSRHGYRIPSVVVTENDTVLAFIERRKGLSDHAQNDIVLRRSEDGGRAWGPEIVLAEKGEHCLCNPCAVVLPSSGRVLMMYQDYPPDRHSVDIPSQRVKRVDPGYTGDKIVRTFVSHSDDNGRTWSAPRDVTSGTKREHVVANGTGPGIGIVLSTGPHRGRIIMPQNDSWYDEEGTRHYDLYASYSDDDGVTWLCGEAAPYDPACKGEGGEVQMVELSDGSVMLNSRSWQGSGLRKISVSRDGGGTWSPVIDDPQLPEPVCMGSILRVRIPGDDDRYCLLFSCPADSSKRRQGTISVNYDDGKTWAESWVMEPHDFAYSCLTQFSDGSIGCFYESYRYKRMIFTRFSFEHLLKNAVSR